MKNDAKTIRQMHVHTVKAHGLMEAEGAAGRTSLYFLSHINIYEHVMLLHAFTLFTYGCRKRRTVCLVCSTGVSFQNKRFTK